MNLQNNQHCGSDVFNDYLFQRNASDKWNYETECIVLNQSTKCYHILNCRNNLNFCRANGTIPFGSNIRSTKYRDNSVRNKYNQNDEEKRTFLRELEYETNDEPLATVKKYDRSGMIVILLFFK